MEKIKDFFENKCEVLDEKIALLDTDFEQIEFVINDEELNTRRFTSVNNVVRFLNPKVDIAPNLEPEIPDVDMSIDFDATIEMLEANKLEEENDNEYYNHILDSQVYPLFFLPTNIEEELKRVTRGKKRKDIDERIKKFFSEEQINKFGLDFVVKNIEIINPDFRHDHAISFYKFFNEVSGEECIEFEEIEKKINTVKYRLNLRYIQSLDYYFIGSIEEEKSLIEQDSRAEHRDPLYFHYNVWKLKGVDSLEVFENFDLHPFAKRGVV